MEGAIMTKTEEIMHNREIRRMEKALERVRVTRAVEAGEATLDIVAGSFMSQSWVYRIVREHIEKVEAEKVQKTIKQAIEDYKKQVNTRQ